METPTLEVKKEVQAKPAEKTESAPEAKKDSFEPKTKPAAMQFKQTDNKSP